MADKKVIYLEEFTSLLKEDSFFQTLSDLEIKHIFNLIDLDESNSIESEEFERFKKIRSKFDFCYYTNFVKFLFSLFDEDGNGEIDRKEMERFFKF